MRWTFAAFGLAMALSVSSAQDEKKVDKKAEAMVDKDKLIGTWTFVKTDAKKQPAKGSSMTLTFTKDGKYDVVVGVTGKSMKLTGTYAVKGDQLTTTSKSPLGKDVSTTRTIIALTDNKLVTAEKKDGVVETTEMKK